MVHLWLRPSIFVAFLYKTSSLHKFGIICRERKKIVIDFIEHCKSRPLCDSWLSYIFNECVSIKGCSATKFYIEWDRRRVVPFRQRGCRCFLVYLWTMLLEKFGWILVKFSEVTGNWQSIYTLWALFGLVNQVTMLLCQTYEFPVTICPAVKDVLVIEVDIRCPYLFGWDVNRRKAIE